MNRLQLNLGRIMISAVVCVLFGAIGAGLTPDANAEEPDALLLALSSRHFNSSNSQLEQMAGGEDQLVARLLQYRTQESPPFVGIRSEKILLSYGDRSDVAAALQSDMQSEQYKGLARTIALHIDKVANPNLRRSLAKSAVERSAREPDFSRYMKVFAESSDEEVQRIGREAQQ